MSYIQTKQECQNDTEAAYNDHIDLWKWDILTQNSCPISSSQRESGSEKASCI